MELSDYQDRYHNAALERSGNGVLTLTLHDGAGGPLKWSESAHTDLAFLFRDIASDTENSVLLLTGAGGHFINGGDPGSFVFDTSVPSPGADRIYREGIDLLHSLLDVNVPVVAAIAGTVCPHAELALMSDIVVAAEDVEISDMHYPNGIVPGDGVHIVWTELLGLNRGRYHLLTGAVITASQAQDWGVVNEVVPAGSELSRARELADQLAGQPALVRRYTRQAITMELRRRVQAELGYGLALEGLASGYGNWR